MNETACLQELTNPIPTSNISKESGISVICDEVRSLQTEGCRQIFRQKSGKYLAINFYQTTKQVIFRQSGLVESKLYLICIELLYSFGFLQAYYG